MDELIDVLTRLENASYRLSENKSELFITEIEWIGHKSDQNGIRPFQDKQLAIKTKQTGIRKGTIIVSRRNPVPIKIYQKPLSSNRYSKTITKRRQRFENIIQKVTEIPCLAHYNSDYPNIITTDASTKGLRAMLWQEQPNGTLKPIGFASRFLSDTEKEYAINELELLAVVRGSEHFRSYIYGNPIKLLTDHQALEPIIKRNRSNKTYSAPLTR